MPAGRSSRRRGPGGGASEPEADNTTLEIVQASMSEVLQQAAADLIKSGFREKKVCITFFRKII